MGDLASRIYLSQHGAAGSNCGFVVVDVSPGRGGYSRTWPINSGHEKEALRA